MSGLSEELPFTNLDETRKMFPNFIATEVCFLIKLRPPGEEQEPTAYLKESITALTNNLVHDMSDGD